MRHAKRAAEPIGIDRGMAEHRSMARRAASFSRTSRKFQSNRSIGSCRKNYLVISRTPRVRSCGLVRTPENRHRKRSVSVGEPTRSPYSPKIHFADPFFLSFFFTFD